MAYLVATYSVMNVLVSSASGGGLADRARPKSQILKQIESLEGV